MKVLVALFALFLRVAPVALAQDDATPKAPTPAAPADHGPPSQPSEYPNPKTPAPRDHEKATASESAPPEPEEPPEPLDPYVHDPYETEPSEDEDGMAEVKPDEPSAAGAYEPDDSHALDGDDTEPDGAAGE